MKRLEINPEVYSLESVEKACQVYQGLARIAVKKKANRIIITFVNCKYDADRTVKEFENYLIGIENL